MKMIPHEVKPELVEIGDEIEVITKTGDLTSSYRGVVASRETHGKTRYLMTGEGRRIHSFEIGGRERMGKKVILHKRQPVPNQTLFDSFDGAPEEVKLRIV